MPRGEETETIIVINDADDFAIVDTMHGRFRRACEDVIQRTGRGRERNREHGIRDGRKVRWEFEIPKECVRLPRPPRELSEEQRETLAARMRDRRAHARPNGEATASVGDPNAGEVGF